MRNSYLKGSFTGESGFFRNCFDKRFAMKQCEAVLYTGMN